MSQPPPMGDLPPVYDYGNMALDPQMQMSATDAMVGMLNPTPPLYPNFEGLPIDLDVGVGVVGGVGGAMSVSHPYAPVPGHAAADANAVLAAGDDQAQPVQTAEFESPNVPGGGPLPKGEFSVVAASAGNAGPSASGMGTLTEFTKRRNWPARVVEELKDMMQLLDAEGKVKFVSPSVEALTGYTVDEIREKFLPDLMHPDDVGVFKAEFNEAIARGAQFRVYFRLKHKDGTWKIFESIGHPHIAAARFAPNPDNQKAFCQAVFIMSRPYPTQLTSDLDKFLEHKLENERLRQRIAELKREEEAEETADSRSSWREGFSETTPSEAAGTSRAMGTPYAVGIEGAGSPTHSANPANSSALTRENLERMTRRDGPDHVKKIEILTGMSYHDGERGRDMMIGKGSPMTIKGDAGIAIPVDRDPRTGEKKKKQKVAEEYVCNDCGTLESPEWRKGPGGPKSLCNACGLRWAKREKKKNANAGAANQEHQSTG